VNMRLLGDQAVLLVIRAVTNSVAPQSLGDTLAARYAKHGVGRTFHALARATLR
jgi:hypothetical protein